jgi:hypothetical protein
MSEEKKTLQYKTSEAQRRANKKYRDAHRAKLREYALSYYYKNHEKIRKRENEKKKEKYQQKKIAKYKKYLEEVKAI